MLIVKHQQRTIGQRVQLVVRFAVESTERFVGSSELISG